MTEYSTNFGFVDDDEFYLYSFLAIGESGLTLVQGKSL